MATDTRNVSFGNLTDAQFRSWGKAIGDALEAVGLVRLTAVEAAGQINWVTVLRPAGMDAVQGFEIFRLNDALQGAAPVFIKINYGSGQSPTGTTPTNRPKITVQIGTGVIAGTGALTGIVSDQFYVAANDWDGNVPPITNDTFYTSGANNRISWAHWAPGVVNFFMAFAVTRIKDATGADTTDGVVVQTTSVSGYVSGANYTETGLAQQQVVRFTGNQPDTPARNLYNAAPVVPCGNASLKSGIVGADTAIWPWIVPSSRGHENPTMAFCGYWDANIGDGTIFAANIYGAAHTYKAFGSPGVPAQMYFDDYTTTELLVPHPIAAGVPANAGTGLAMRWE